MPSKLTRLQLCAHSLECRANKLLLAQQLLGRVQELVSGLPASQQAGVRQSHLALSVAAASRLPEESCTLAAVDALLQDPAPLQASCCSKVLKALAARQAPSDRLHTAMFSVAARSMLSCSAAEGLQLATCVARAGASPEHLQQLLQACCRMLRGSSNSASLLATTGPQKLALRQWLVTRAWNLGAALLKKQRREQGEALLSLAVELLQAAGASAELLQSQRLEAALAQQRALAGLGVAGERECSALQQQPTAPLLAVHPLETEHSATASQPKSGGLAAQGRAAGAAGEAITAAKHEGAFAPAAAEPLGAAVGEASPMEADSMEAAPMEAASESAMEEHGRSSSMGRQSSAQASPAVAGHEAAEALPETAPSSPLAAADAASIMFPAPPRLAPHEAAPWGTAAPLSAPLLSSPSSLPVQQVLQPLPRAQAPASAFPAFRVSSGSGGGSQDSGSDDSDADSGAVRGPSWLDATAAAQKRCEGRQAAAAAAGKRQARETGTSVATAQATVGTSAGLQLEHGSRMGATGRGTAAILATDGADELCVSELE